MNKVSPKLKMARRMMTQQERKDHVAPFSSMAWTMRTLGIRDRVYRQQHKKLLKGS